MVTGSFLEKMETGGVERLRGAANRPPKLACPGGAWAPGLR
jgi:hypothetical protein